MFYSVYPQPTIVSSGSAKPTVKFPEDVQVILRADRASAGNLFISNVEAAQNKAILQNLKIGAILCVAKGYGTKHSSSLVKHAKYLAVEDDDNADISKYLSEGVTFITQKLKTTNVLVHCVAGTNRSAAFVIAYLMKQVGLSLEDAYNEVKSRRKVISPSESAIKQLKEYQQSIGISANVIKTNQSFHFNQPSTVYESPQRSIRIKTNQNRSNFLEVADQRSARGSKAGSKVRMDELDERRSYRPSSCHSNHVIEVSQPKVNRNPQESFISRQSKAPSALNKSFYASSQQGNQSVIHQPPVPASRIESSNKTTREQFLQKMSKTESKNRQINHRFQLVQERFDHSEKHNRMQLENQMNNLTQVRSNLQSRQSERKGRIMQHRELHDKSMLNQEAQQYMASLPLETALKRRL